ncbi:hypothetical protein P8605_16495 [Streptomyces sp. T-3]|nr:hypothetical protein [Streptomyces sp. T-3]
MRRTAAILAAAFSTLALAALPGASAQASAPAPALPGKVCFWSQPNEHDPQGGWCYTPGTGFAVPAEHVLRKARSFTSQVNQTVYALHFPGSGPCLHRTIYGGDYDMDWEWGSKLDAIQTDRPTDCQPG